jgi:hypothetical protein
MLESQLFPLLASFASFVTPGKASGLEPPFDFSHAARVAGSTGQTSGEVSVSFAILNYAGLRIVRVGMRR